MQEPPKRIAIIGAGSSGLPAIKNALDYDLEPTCFEKNSQLGGLWLYKAGETEDATVMKSTIINTSKEMSAYSTFPPPAEAANFMHNTALIEYFRAYARHYDLNRYIRYNHEIVRIERAPDYGRTGQWVVHYKSSDNDWTRNETFDGVLLAVGHHKTPHFPEPWPGQAEFRGQIKHSHSYKDHLGYEDKVCVVVGIGNSGVDVATELSHVAKQVYLSTRRGTWLVNRVGYYGLPFDITFRNRFVGNFAFFLSRFTKSIEDRLNERLDHELYGLKPKHPFTSAHPTVNDELPNRLASGTCKIRPNIERFTKTGVVFVDGQSVDHVDEVIFCTGYHITLPNIEEGNLIRIDENNHVQAYKYMFPLATSDWNTLGILGMIQPLGAIMPISEMQSRVFYEQLIGRIRLPSMEQMLDDCRNREEKMAKRYVSSNRHTIQVDYLPYMDELASMFGAKPNLLRYLITDYRLGRELLFGPNVAYVYRLNGPHPWPGAREAILTVLDRVCAPTKPKIPFSDEKNNQMKKSSATSMASTFVLVTLGLSTAYFIIRNRSMVTEWLESLVQKLPHK